MGACDDNERPDASRALDASPRLAAAAMLLNVQTARGRGTMISHHNDAKRYQHVQPHHGLHQLPRREHPPRHRRRRPRRLLHRQPPVKVTCRHHGHGSACTLDATPPSLRCKSSEDDDNETAAECICATWLTHLDTETARRCKPLGVGHPNNVDCSGRFGARCHDTGARVYPHSSHP